MGKKARIAHAVRGMEWKDNPRHETGGTLDFPEIIPILVRSPPPYDPDREDSVIEEKIFGVCVNCSTGLIGLTMQ